MVYFLLGTGFEPMEAVVPVDILRRGGVEVRTLGIGATRIEAAHGIVIETDGTVEQAAAEDAEMVVLPGGMGGVHSLRQSGAALEIVKKAYNDGKFVCAICAGPTVLAGLGLLDGKRATCYPGCEPDMAGAVCTGVSVERDGRLITGRAPGSSADFGLALLAALRGEKAAEEVGKGLVYTR